MIVFTILVVSASLFARIVAATSQLREVNRESAVAAEAARVVIEQMHNRPFEDVFALYNPDPADDPGGVGTAPGSRFAVVGLEPLPGSAGTHLEVILPALAPETPSQLDGTKWYLSEEERLAGGKGGGGKGGGGGGEGGGGGSEGGGPGGAPEPEFWELREDYHDPELGLPRDLNGDSIIDAEDHAEDYILLPVLIRVEWAGRFGPRTYDTHTMLAEFRQP